MIKCPRIIGFKREALAKINVAKDPNDLSLLTGLGNKIKDYFILELNQFVYRKNCAGEELNFNVFAAYLRSQEKLERKIAEDNNKILLHLRKWTRVRRSLDLDLPEAPSGAL